MGKRGEGNMVIYDLKTMAKTEINENTVVAINNDQKVTLKELLPERWDKKWD